MWLAITLINPPKKKSYLSNKVDIPSRRVGQVDGLQVDVVQKGEVGHLNLVDGPLSEQLRGCGGHC